MTTPREKFQKLLRVLFQLDNSADLDFGIYRIMNHKRDVIEQFIEKDLLNAVSTELRKGRLADEANAAERLEELKTQIKEMLGADALNVEGQLNAAFEKTNIGKEYLALQQSSGPAKDNVELETQIFNHLHAFFSRYYDEGDFMALRRYSRRKRYAIPYNGEQVYLHWANSDQYYIKTGENFTDYTYKHEQWTVRFKLRNADVETNNRKGASRFFVPQVDALELDTANHEITLPFEYRLLKPDEKTKFGTTKIQEQILSGLLPQIVAARSATDGLAALVHEKRRDAQNNPVTLLEHHLRTYTQKNNRDFFIHKDLRRFLEGELDFFLKNEVLNLDELESAGSERGERWFELLSIIRNLGQRVIRMLSQIEDFQKKLFTKKKFVTEVRYAVTLDRVPEKLFPKIIENGQQIRNWKEKFEIDKIAPKLTTPGFSDPLTSEFLQAHKHLVLDTSFFDQHFVDELTSSSEFSGSDLDGAVGGVLIASENLQAAWTIAARWPQFFSCFYSDPPFNLGINADFPYKTDYQDSTWLTLLENRLSAVKPMLSDDALIFVRCDYHGSSLVRDLLQQLGFTFKAEVLIDRSRNEAGSPNKMEATYEHLFMFGLNDLPIRKFKVQRSRANSKWTGFLMAGDRNPPERVFLGKTLVPPAGQHFTLVQTKVDKLLDDFFLRLRCRDCSSLYFRAQNDSELELDMKSRVNQFKFYDIKSDTKFHGVQELVNCLDCGGDRFAVQYLGSDEVYVSDNWLDIPSYSRLWGFSTENSEELLDRVSEFNDGPLIDLFGGSGTTAAVAMKKKRPWVICESGTQIDDVIWPRLKSVLNGEQSGISAKHQWTGKGVVKYVRLESYDDALDNIVFGDVAQQLLVLDDYLIKYMLDFETKESATFLNVSQLDSPFDYKLFRHGNDEPLPVDLPETFNYLIGLHVKTRRLYESNGARYLVYRGQSNERETVVIWRTTKGWGQPEFEADRKFIEKEKLTVGAETIFVNTDSFVTGAVSLDPVFKRLMFNET